MNTKLIQIKDAAKILGVSKLTLRNWDKAKKLVAFRHPINNYRVYRYEDIEKLINQMSNPAFIPTLWKTSESKKKTFDVKIRHINN